MPVNLPKNPLALSLMLASFAGSAAAQGSVWSDSLSLFRYTQPVQMTLLLPPDGPGASLLNPARLADGEKLYAQFGTRKSGDARGNVRGNDISLGGGFFQRLYLGAYLTGSSGRFVGTNAVLLDNRFGLQAAYRHSLDPEGKGHFSIGLTNSFRQINQMSTYKANGYTPDIGVVLVPTAYPGGWKLEFGWAAQDLRSFGETAPRPVSDPKDPDRYTHVDFAPWLTTGSAIATSPAQHWSLFTEAAAGAIYKPAYRDRALQGWDIGMARLYLPRIGATYRPIPPLSVGLERAWGRYWSLHTTLGTGNWLPFRCEADLRTAYGPYLLYHYPDREGWTLAWNLRAIW
jgi:hypothetical protein